MDVEAGRPPVEPHALWALGACYLPLTRDLPALAAADHPNGCGGSASGGSGTRRGGHWPDPDSLAYVLFTSGSTGAPKAVGATHRTMMSAVHALRERLQVGAGERIVQASAAVFDPSILEIVLAAVIGGELITVDAATRRDPRLLARLLSDSRADFVELTPTVWSGLAGALGRMAHVPRLRASGGEALSGALAGALRSVPGTVWNLYGPSETTMWATAGLITDGPVHVGPPLVNTALAVVDQAGRPLPRGVVGEIIIGGGGVCPGYLGGSDPGGAFADRTVFDGIARPSYRTGDLGCLDETGQLWLAGRWCAYLTLVVAPALTCAGPRTARRASGSAPSSFPNGRIAGASQGRPIWAPRPRRPRRRYARS